MAYESRGEAYNNLHQYDKAIADFGRAIAQQPDLILAYGERGLAELGAGKYDAAIDDFDKAIAQKPDWAEPYFGRGSAHRHKREYDAAIADLSRALQLDPTNPVAYSELGYSHYGLMDYAAALSDADTAIRLDSKLVAAYRVRAHAHLGLGDAAAAVKDLSVGLAIKPDAGLLDERADANRINGALAEADSDLQRAEKLGSDTSLHHMVRGLVRFERGDFAAAHSAFAAAAALAPDDLYPPLWKIIASLRHGDDPGSQILDATTTYDLKQWPGPLIIFAGATPSFDNDDSIEAEAAQGDTATRGDRACEVAFYVGEIYLAAGRAAEAEDRFKQAVDRCPRVYTTANMARFELHQMSAQFSEPASPADASSSAAPLPGEASTLSATDEVHFVGLYILNAAGVYDAETADDPNAADARWIMHGVTGKLTVRKDLSPEQGDAMIEDMIQGLSEACPAGQLHVLRPDFAPPLIGRLRASCSNELYGAYYILLRRPKGGTYIWTTSSDHTLDPARQASDLDNKLAAALTGQAIPEK
jgi:tetratricopeptide (TPR) repeat protein